MLKGLKPFVHQPKQLFSLHTGPRIDGPRIRLFQGGLWKPFGESTFTGPGTPRAHDVRGVATSWALFQGVPLKFSGAQFGRIQTHSFPVI